jgi:hypothetical protein
MAKTPTYDPRESEVLSPLMAGFSEALSKLSGVLNLNTKQIKGVTLEKLPWINGEGRTVMGVLYQAPNDNRLWLSTPPPVIRKNGSIISPSSDHFTIDPIGGGLFFEEMYSLLEDDVVTVDATIVIEESKTLYDILNDISELKTKAAHDKGFYETDTALKEAHSTGVSGDFAIVGSTDTMWLWDADTQQWKDSHKATDFSNYYNKSEIDNFLSQKEPLINKRGDSVGDDDYYYGGRKQWIDLLYKVRNTALTGVDFSTKTVIEATDTVIAAFGKLQGQINDIKQTNTNQEEKIKAIEKKNEDQDSSISNLQSEKADKAELPNNIIAFTLTTAAWQNVSEGIHKQTITNENIKDSMKLNISFTDTSMLKTLADAGVYGLLAENDAGTATVYVYGEKPTVEIPVQVEIVPIVTE